MKKIERAWTKLKEIKELNRNRLVPLAGIASFNRGCGKCLVSERSL